MERVFTKDMGRYAVGDIHDWPWPTWQQIADHAGIKVSDFSRKTEEIVAGKVKRYAHN